METNTQLTESTQQTFKSALGRVGCHMENVSVLMQKLDDTYVEVDGKFIKITPEVALKLMASLFKEFQNTVEVCENKTIEIEFGDTPLANLMETVLEFILKFAENLKD